AGRNRCDGPGLRCRTPRRSAGVGAGKGGGPTGCLNGKKSAGAGGESGRARDSSRNAQGPGAGGGLAGAGRVIEGRLLRRPRVDQPPAASLFPAASGGSASASGM